MRFNFWPVSLSLKPISLASCRPNALVHSLNLLKYPDSPTYWVKPLALNCDRMHLGITQGKRLYATNSYPSLARVSTRLPYVISVMHQGPDR
ncbi:hypothetical protein Y032_0224g2706 [Ancylostoma ceylanicum]|uniref:Uncharacterized protein n=1 Tax=Ancylostoma ceylanicum TaxID=53326 RepID=A0A016SHD8_9BILA|nr:hypothetical protein Y032_0224g2706 [Ancylostoma ceylanicum]